MLPLDSGPGPDDPTRVDNLAGRALGKYRLLRWLGAGGMGVVFEAEDGDLRRKVAVKILMPKPGTTGESAALAERFLREVRAAAHLSHPNVVPIYDVNKQQMPAYFVMEYLPGGSVAQLAQSQGKLSWRNAVELIVQAGRGLAAAHAAGLVHRDVKPGNLLLAADGTVKVADFGLVKVVDLGAGEKLGNGNLSGPSQALGTPHFMSPEQCRGEALDERTDVYSLAISLFVLLAGRVPFDADSVYGILYAHCSAAPPDIKALAPDVPDALVEAVKRGMARTRAARYGSMKAFVAALERVLKAAPEGPTPAAPVAAVPSVRPRRTSRRLLLVALLVVCVGAAGWGMLRLLGGHGGDPRPPAVPVDPDEVQAKLREVNPQWKGTFQPEFDGERVVGLKLNGGGALTDLEPLTALADLEELSYEGPSYAKGRLNDLGPLAKLTRLKQLTIRHCAVTDLSPLGKLKLEKLDLVATRVNNLKPLRGQPLKLLHLHGTQVADLSPLIACPDIEDLYCPRTVETLEPLRRLTGLKKVQLYGCDKVTSLSPLAGSPVEYLDCRGVGIKDLDELANWPHLRVLYCDGRFAGKIPPLPKLARLELDPLFTGKKP